MNKCPTFGERFIAGTFVGVGVGVAAILAVVVLGNIATGR